MNYIKCGDYFIPALAVKPTKPLGKYGGMALDYIRKNKRILYSTLKIKGELFDYLHEIEDAFNEQLAQMLKHAEQAAPDKRTDQMAWVGYMNNVKHQAEEILKAELIYN